MQRHNKRQRQTGTHQYTNQHLPLPTPTPPLTATTVITDQLFACMNNKPAYNARRRVPISYIEDRTRRHITFSKRKAGLIKKANELACLTGTEIMLLVASEAALSTAMENQPLNLGPPLSNSGRPLICKFVRMIPPDSNRHMSQFPNSTNPPPPIMNDHLALDSGQILEQQQQEPTTSDPVQLTIPSAGTSTTNFTTKFTGYHHQSTTANSKFPAPMPFQTQSVFESHNNSHTTSSSAYVPPTRSDSKISMNTGSSHRPKETVSNGRIQYPLSPNISSETTYNNSSSNLASETPYVFDTQTPYVLNTTTQQMPYAPMPLPNNLFSHDQSSPLDDILAAQPGTVHHNSTVDNYSADPVPSVYTNSVHGQISNLNNIPDPIPTSNSNPVNQHTSCNADPIIPTSSVHQHTSFGTTYNIPGAINSVNSGHQHTGLHSNSENYASAYNMITDPIEYVNSVVHQHQQYPVSSSSTNPVLHSSNIVNQHCGSVYHTLPDPIPTPYPNTTNHQRFSPNNSTYTIPEPILASAGYPVTSTNPLSYPTNLDTSWPEPLSTVSATFPPMSSETPTAKTSSYPPAASEYHYNTMTSSMDRLLGSNPEYCSLLPCDQQTMYAMNNVLNTSGVTSISTLTSSGNSCRYRGAGTY